MNKLPWWRREKPAIFVTKPGVDSSSIGGTLYRVKANHQWVRDAVMLGRVVPIVCRNAPRIDVSHRCCFARCKGHDQCIGKDCTCSAGFDPGRFDSPDGFAVNPFGRVVITDTFNNRIQICSRDGVCTAFGGPVVRTFDRPRDISVDRFNRIRVAEDGRLQRCNDAGRSVGIQIPNPLRAGSNPVRFAFELNEL